MPIRSALLSAVACLLLVTPARAQQADDVLWWNTSNLAFPIAGMQAALTSVGAVNVIDTDTWPADLLAYRLVFLVIPDDPFTTAQIADVQAFLDNGGLLVTVADNDNYDDEIDELNALLLALGISSSHVYAMLDVTCPHSGTIVPGHPLVAGVTGFDYAASSDLAVAGDGVTLATGESGQTLLAYEGGVVLAADTGIFTDWCAWQTSDDLVINLFTVWCDMDADGHDKPICGGGDCADEDAALYPGQPEVLDGLDNDCNGLVDDGIVAAGAVIVSEIMKDPDAVVDVAGEWFELHNTSSDTIDLVGMVVSDLTGSDFTVDAALVVPPGGTAVLGRYADPAINGGVPVDFVYAGFNLDNVGADEVILTHGATELDRVEFDDVDWPNTPGASLTLDPAFLDAAANDDPALWCPATSAYGAGDLGTPRSANDGCCDDDSDGYIDVGCGGDDCDDADPAVSPGAAEVTCDSVDNDCDAATLDQPDADGDGVGLCAGDCDDTEPAVYPLATELCDDGLDNDCDGAVDAADSDCAGDDDDSGPDDDDVGPDDDDVGPDDDDSGPDDDDSGPDDDDSGPDDDDSGPDDDDLGDDDFQPGDDDFAPDDDDQATDDDDSGDGDDDDASDCNCAQSSSDGAPALLLLALLAPLLRRRAGRRVR